MCLTTAKSGHIPKTSDHRTHNMDTFVINIYGCKACLSRWWKAVVEECAYADVQTFAREMGGGMAIGDHSIKGGGG